MSIFTTPVFYYGYTVTQDNVFLNFSEGGGPELTANIRPGTYTITDLGNEISTKLNDAGALEYTVTINRNTRQFTISAGSNFSLLFSTGTNAGVDIGQVIGFSADQTGASSYTGSVTGSEYVPQFPLQDYVDLNDFQEFAQAKVNESSSGSVEIYSIGARKFTEFNIGPITNNQMRKGGLFIANTSAVNELRSFMEFIITKAPIEFMPDRENRSSNVKTLILERTPTSSTGTGFKLRELYGRGLVGFFETGLLRFRERS